MLERARGGVQEHGVVVVPAVAAVASASAAADEAAAAAPAAVQDLLPLHVLVTAAVALLHYSKRLPKAVVVEFARVTCAPPTDTDEGLPFCFLGYSNNNLAKAAYGYTYSCCSEHCCLQLAAAALY